MPTIAPQPLPDLTDALKPQAELPDMTAGLKPANVDVQRAAADTDIFRQQKPTFTTEGPELYQQAYAGNKQFAKPGPYHTPLSPEEEKQFRSWLKSSKNTGGFDPDAPISDYDMRGYWKDVVSKGKGAAKAGEHFPDTYKTPYDTTFSAESKYATPDNPYVWQGDTLVDKRSGAPRFGMAPEEQPLPVTGPHAAGLSPETIAKRAELQQKKTEGAGGSEAESDILMDPVTQAALMMVAPMAGAGMAGAGLAGKLAAGAIPAAEGALTLPAWATAGVAADKAAGEMPYVKDHPWLRTAVANAALIGAPMLGGYALGRARMGAALRRPMEEEAGTAQPEDPEVARVLSGQPRRTAYQKPVDVAPEAPVQSEGPTEAPAASDSAAQGRQGIVPPAGPKSPQTELTEALAKRDPGAVKRALSVELGRMPGAEVLDIPISKIRTKPEELQYKLGYGKEGAGLALNKAEAWNPWLANVMTLMHDPERPGDFLAVNGHQRLSLAKRAQDIVSVDEEGNFVKNPWEGDRAVRSQILPEGTSYQQARAVGALQNIAEEKGTIVDAAKFMRDTKATPEMMAREGIDLKSNMMQGALALKNLDDGIFRDVATGRMKPSRGVVIGEAFPDNQASQRAVLKGVRDYEKTKGAMTDQKLKDLIQIEKDWGNFKGKEVNPVLWGKEEIEKSYSADAADLVGYIRSNLMTDKRLFKTAAEKAKRLKQGGTEVAKEQAEEISTGAASRLAALESRGPETNAVLKKYAPELAQASKSERPKILKAAYNEAFDSLERDFGAQKALGGIAPEAPPAETPSAPAAPEAPKPAAPAPPTPELPATQAEQEAAGQGAMFGAAPKAEGIPPEQAARADEILKEHFASNRRAMIQGLKNPAGLGPDAREAVEDLTNASPAADHIARLEQQVRGEQAAREYADDVDRRMASEPQDIYAGIPVTQLAKKLEPFFKNMRQAFRETVNPERISEASQQAYRSVNKRFSALEWQHKYMSDQFHADLRSKLGALAKPQQEGIVDSFEKGDFNAIPADQQPYWKAYKQIGDDIHDWITRVKGGGQQGLYQSTVGYIENYFPHLYADDPAKVREAFSKYMGTLKQSSKFLGQRRIPYMSIAKQAGLTPKFENPADQMLAGLYQEAKWATGQEILQDGKDAGYVQRFNNMRELPPNWERIPDPIANILQYSEPEKGMVQRGFWAAPKEWNRVISRSLNPSNMGQATRGLYHIKNMIAGAKVGLSLFHPMLTAISNAVLNSGDAIYGGIEDMLRGDFKNGTFRLASAIPKGIDVRSAFRDRALGQQILKMNPNSPEVQMLIAGGMGPGSKVAAEMATESLTDALNIPGPMQKFLHWPMENWVRPLKIGEYYRHMQNEIASAVERGQPLTGTALERMAQDTAAASDWRLGQVATNRLLLPTTMRDAVRLAVNFPSWQAGTLKIFGGTARGLRQLATGREVDQQAKMALKYMIGLGVMAPLYGTMADIVTKGQLPASPLHAYVDAADNLPIYILRDMVSYAGHYEGEGFKQGTGRYVMGKLSPLIAAAEMYWNNRDPTNWRQITYPSQKLPAKVESIVKAAIHQVAPFSGLTFMEQRERDIQSGEYKGPLQEAAKDFAKATFGVRPPPPSLERTATENFIAQNRPKFDRPAASPAEFNRWQARQAVATQIRHGKFEAAMNAFNMGVQQGILSRDADAKAIRKMVNDQVTSAIEESSFPFAIEFWKFANAQHDVEAKAKIEAALQKKLQNGAWSKLSKQEQDESRDTLITILRSMQGEKEGARP